MKNLSIFFGCMAAISIPTSLVLFFNQWAEYRALYKLGEPAMVERYNPEFASLFLIGMGATILFMWTDRMSKKNSAH